MQFDWYRILPRLIPFTGIWSPWRVIIIISSSGSSSSPCTIHRYICCVFMPALNRHWIASAGSTSSQVGHKAIEAGNACSFSSWRNALAKTWHRICCNELLVAVNVTNKHVFTFVFACFCRFVAPATLRWHGKDLVSHLSQWVTRSPSECHIQA